jgi:trk system potassium uptake protein TrkH
MSEWIIAWFMMFAGMSFGLWSLFFFGKHRFSWKCFWRSQEFRFYAAYTFVTTILIAHFLHTSEVHYSTLDSLRYAFFNVTTIVSTTGLGNWDFATWPPQAIGILFVCYLLGGMVGSTAGGLKALRYVVSGRYMWQVLRQFATGQEAKQTLKVDGVTYTARESVIIIINIALYFIIFLMGAIILMVISPQGQLASGAKVTLDLGTALAASIANLGNIGPGNFFSNGWNVGPTGNYFAFSVAGKWLLITLMYLGRVGVLTLFFVLMSRRAIHQLYTSIARVAFGKRD